MSQVNGTCGDCRFIEHFPERQPYQAWECRRNPPSHYYGHGGYCQRSWPQMIPDIDWCYEFKGKD